MAAKYSVVFSNTADAYSYSCTYEPLGCDSIKFQMTFDIESFPLYVGGGISVGTLKFIKEDADELRTLFAANALYDLKVTLTNIASGVSWGFYADWSNYSDDGNFVEIALTITNLRERIKAVNLQDINGNLLWQALPITNKPALINRFTMNEPREIAFYTTDSQFLYLFGITEKRTINDWDIVNGQTLDKFNLIPHADSAYFDYQVNELLNYFVPNDAADDIDSSLGITIDGTLDFVFDSLHASSVALSTFMSSPVFTIKIESVLRKTTSGGTITEQVIGSYSANSNMNDSGFSNVFTGIFPVYRALKYTDYGLNEFGTIQHVIRLVIQLSGTKTQNYKWSYFKMSGSMYIRHNIVQVDGSINAVVARNIAANVNSAYGLMFDDGDFSTRILLTTPLAAWQGTSDKNFASLTLENFLQTYSLMTASVLYEYLNGYVKVLDFDNFVTKCLLNPYNITHYYDFAIVGRDLSTLIVAGQDENDNGLMFEVDKLWGEQRYQLQASQAKKNSEQLTLKGNVETNGQRVFSALVKGDQNTPLMLYRDIFGGNIVYQPTGFINEFFSVRRVLGRLASYLFSRTPTHDNIEPTPTPTPQYSSTIPSDNGIAVDNQSAVSYPSPSYAFKPYKVKCKMLLTTPTLKLIMQNPIFSFKIDNKYYYPTSMAIGIESDTYEVEMLEFE